MPVITVLRYYKFTYRLNKRLHIVSMDIPGPPDYGGVMDIYATAAALHARGVEVILHCFEYGARKRIADPGKLCTAVYYYPRKKGFSFNLPYIVSSRVNEELYRRMLEDEAPILLEGIHCSYPVLDQRFSGRKIVVRSFNVEYDYYAGLAKHARSVLKKWYYQAESRMLKRYERRVAQKATILTLSEADAKIYTNELGGTDTHFVPVFFHDTPDAQPGTGNYCLYHGNLSVEENEVMALWLAREVFSGMNIPLVIAGKKPSGNLLKAVQSYPNITVKADLSETEMHELVANAQLNVLPSVNSTGVKLKILYALHHGRFCITNTAGKTGIHNHELIAVANDAASFKTWIGSHFQAVFTAEMAEQRKKILEENFSAEKRLEQFTKYLW